MNQPLISIITPTYKQNDFEKLHRMIQSIATQSYSHWEHIICSDGISEPNIASIVKGYNDIRRKYMVSKQHYGGWGSSVREEVMTEQAKGKYLVFLDDDNIIFPDYLEKMVNAVETATDGEKFAICKILHFGPVIEALGPAPLYLEGEPKLCYIDTLQIMVEADAMRQIGWVAKDHYCSDGYTYQKLGETFKYVRIKDCLAIHV